MAGKKPTILVTPTADLGKVLNSMASLQIEGEANFCASSQIAQLALKHRENKNQRQRIVMFVGSPLAETKVRRPPCCLLLPMKQTAEGIKTQHFTFAEAPSSRSSVHPHLIASAELQSTADCQLRTGCSR